MRQPLIVLLKRLAQHPLTRQSRQLYLTFFVPFPRHILKERIDGVRRRHIELRKWILYFLQLQLATLRDFPRAINRILMVAEQRQHLVTRLQVELGRVEPQAVRIFE